jgi:glycosyltransferase involved in cell wall biosynthesis
MKILHVTECMAGGVQTVVTDSCARQARNGHTVTLTYLSRPLGATDVQIRNMVGPSVQVNRLEAVGNPILRIMKLRRWLLRRHNEYDIIHLHSTLAGLAGRLPKTLSTGTVYSPHGFSFSRMDLPLAIRVALRGVEKAAARGTGILLTSPSEFRLAAEHLRTETTEIAMHRLDLPNAAELAGKRQAASYSARPADGGCNMVTVAMAGRICYQKAPERFARLADALYGSANFVWIGDGDHVLKERLLESGVEVTGWYEPSQFMTRLSEMDILVHCTRWEGHPYVPRLASAVAIPVVVSNTVGNVDTVEDGSSGFIVESDAEMVQRVQSLIEDPKLREALGLRGHHIVMESISRPPSYTDEDFYHYVLKGTHC